MVLAARTCVCHARHTPIYLYLLMRAHGAGRCRRLSSLYAGDVRRAAAEAVLVLDLHGRARLLQHDLDARAADEGAAREHVAPRARLAAEEGGEVLVQPRLPERRRPHRRRPLHRGRRLRRRRSLRRRHPQWQRPPRHARRRPLRVPRVADGRARRHDARRAGQAVAPAAVATRAQPGPLQRREQRLAGRHADLLRSEHGVHRHLVGLHGPLPARRALRHLRWHEPRRAAHRRQQQQRPQERAAARGRRRRHLKAHEDTNTKHSRRVLAGAEPRPRASTRAPPFASGANRCRHPSPRDAYAPAWRAPGALGLGRWPRGGPSAPGEEESLLFTPRSAPRRGAARRSRQSPGLCPRIQA
mmetsp:Transcript_16686/g.51259  ORF Transcript_16686/g.51259 Transcript_16686/m.51259 type:complete len:357 (-) Transcript_16686:55-1125(-)